MSINFTDYELSEKELAFADTITREYEMALNHDVTDLLDNNGWY